MKSYILEQFLALQENLLECTPAQQELFKRMYPKGPSEEQWMTAYEQVDRTLAKNAEEGET